MSTPETEVVRQDPSTVAGFDTARGFELLQRQAKMLSESDLIPAAFKKNVPNCAIAIELAWRLDMSPLMVVQNLSIIQGKPSWASQFIIGQLNRHRRFRDASIKYIYDGAPGEDSWSCRVEMWDERVVPPLVLAVGPTVSIAMSKAEGWYQRNGSKWKTLPELMLSYRAAAFFGRLHCPELLCGLPTDSEIIDITPRTSKAEVAGRFADPPPAAQGGAGDVIEAETVPDEATPFEPVKAVFRENSDDCPHDGGTFSLKGVESCVKCGAAVTS